MEFIFGLKAEKGAGEKIRPFSGNDPTINRPSWSDPENRNLPRHQKIKTLSCKTTSLCCTHVCSSYWGPFSRCLRKEMPCGLHFSYVCPEEEQSSPFTRQIELSMTILWKADNFFLFFVQLIHTEKTFFWSEDRIFSKQSSAFEDHYQQTGAL